MRVRSASPWTWTLLWVLALFVLRLAALRDPALFERDAEEGFSAAQGWMMRQGHLRDLFFMQYRPYCGGCTLQAAAAAGLSILLPLSWITFKLLPIGVWGLALACGQRWLHAVAGARSGVVFALLMLMPPRTPLVLSATGWANHMEAGCLAVALLAARGVRPVRGPGRAALVGLVGGVAVYTSFSGAFVAAGAVLVLVAALRRRGQAIAIGLLLVALVPAVGWTLQWGLSGNQPLHIIYAEDEWTPRLARVPAKLLTLVHPHQLTALVGHPAEQHGAPPWGPAAGLALLWAGVGALGVSARARGLHLPVGLALLWLLAYGLSGFSVQAPLPPELAYPGGLRYAAAVLPLCAVIVASAARAVPGVVLAVPALCAGVLAVAPALRIEPSWLATVGAGTELLGRGRLDGEADAADWRFVRAQLSYALPIEHHRACRSADRRCREVHAYAEARAAATSALRADPAGACGVALVAVPERNAGAAGVGEAVAQHIAARLDAGGVHGRNVVAEADRCLRAIWPGGPPPAAAIQEALVSLTAHASRPWGDDTALHLVDPEGGALAATAAPLRAPLAFALGARCAPAPGCAPSLHLPPALIEAAIDGIAWGNGGRLRADDPRLSGPHGSALRRSLDAVWAERLPARPAWWPDPRP